MGAPVASSSMSKPLKSNASLVSNAIPSMAKPKAEDSSIPSKTPAGCSNQKGAASSSVAHSIMRIGPRLRAEGLMVPPASDAATLRRQVAALQADLEAHIAGEQRLQNINRQLRERLELYMKQNHENVERAEKELNALHEDMEQTLELQRRLAQRATALEKEKRELEQALHKSVQEFEEERAALQLRICALTDDLKARADAEAQASSLQAELESTLDAKIKLEEGIQKYCMEADILKQKANDYSKELQAIMMKEKKNQIIAKHCRRPLLRRMLYSLRDATERQRAAKVNEEVAEAFSNEKCCKRGLYAMQVAIARSKWMRQAEARQSKACLREVWRAWLLEAIADRRYHQALEGRKRLCAQRSFQRWKSLLGMARLSPDDEQQLTDVAKAFWRNSSCGKAFRGWRWWIDCFSKPRKTRLSSIQNSLNQLIKRHTLATWRSFVCLSHVNYLKLQQANEKAKSLCQRRTLRRWQEGILVLRYEKLLTEKALQFKSFYICRRAMKSWCRFIRMRQHRKASEALAFRHYIWNLQSKGLAVWRHNIKFQQAEVRAVLEVNQALMKASMILWREYHVSCAVKKRKERKADAYRRRKAHKIARIVLFAWWEDMAWKRRASQLEHLVISRRQHKLLVISLHCWMHSTFENLLASNAKIQNDLLEAKALFEEQKHQTTAVDVENLQLIDRLHTMSSEIAYLKMTISEKEKQEEELHRALEDGAFIESSMKGELEQQHIRIEELELNILSLQKKIQSKNAEDTAEEVHHTLEIQNMEQAVNDLRIQLAEKSAQLKSYEKALKETAEKLEGASDESQEKLCGAFKMASSLRKLLEDRENQYAALEGTCRRKELELEELQEKLAVVNSTFSETVEAREARIRELEALLAQKHSDIHHTQQEMQELRLALDTKDSLVRKLEYEIKLKTDQELHQSKNFVSSLSAWPMPYCDSASGLRSHVHSIQLKESMRHVYTQAKAALHRMGNRDVASGGSGSAENRTTTTTTVQWSTAEGRDSEGVDEILDDGKQRATIEEAESPEVFPEEIEPRDSSSSVLEKAVNLLASYKGGMPGGLHPIEEVPDSAEWDSTADLTLFEERPASSVDVVGGESTSMSSATLLTDSGRGSADSDGLHVQIQRLQARIKSQLRRDSPSSSASSPSEEERSMRSAAAAARCGRARRHAG